MKLIEPGNRMKYERIARVMELKAKGLSFREIAEKMGSDVKSVYRWYSYTKTHDVGTYPQYSEK